MKTHFSLFIALGLFTLPLAAGAQLAIPQLTAANTTPTPGFVHNTLSTNTFNPGGSGSNQNWDFSNLSYTADAPTIYGTCATLNSNCSPYANPNLVSAGQLDTNSAKYHFAANANGYSLIGLALKSSSDSFNNTYTNSRDVLRYPMTFNTSFTDAWNYKGYYYNSSRSGSGIDTVTADAWGSIKTPAGTFLALRVRTNTTQYDTATFAGMAYSKDRRHAVIYSWFDAYNKHFIYSGTIATSAQFPGFIGTRGTYAVATPAGINPIAEKAFSWTVAPNPATGNKLQVRVEGVKSAMVNLRLTNLLGRELRTLAANSGSPADGVLTLETAGLPAGTYILSVATNGQPQGAQCITIAD